MKNIRSDYLYLIWKNPQTRSRHLIGTLKKNGKYEFQYSPDIKKYQEKGFDLLVSFPDINKKYVSENLFPEFLSRIPGPNRIDIKDILKKYNLKSYDAFELLKRSGAKTSLDTLEFIDPILNLKEKNITREFYIAGTRYYCTKNSEEEINIGDNVTFELEPDNKIDCYAIKMIINNIFVGYMPQYYSKIVNKYLTQKNSKQYSCVVIDKTGACEECLKVRMILNKD